MTEWIRRLSFRAEFVIVILAALGLGLAGSVFALVAPLLGHYSGGGTFTNGALVFSIIFELGVGGLLWYFLTLRGWTPADVGLSLQIPQSRALLNTTLIAIGFVVSTYAIAGVLITAVASVMPWMGMQWARVAPRLPLFTVLVASAINATYEEVFECGYVISSLRERIGVTKAINVSAGIRVALHLYQGPVGVLSITPFALISAIWFARTKRLAPLILAHAAVDIIGLGLASRG